MRNFKKNNYHLYSREHQVKVFNKEAEKFSNNIQLVIKGLEQKLEEASFKILEQANEGFVHATQKIRVLLEQLTYQILEDELVEFYNTGNENKVRAYSIEVWDEIKQSLLKKAEELQHDILWMRKTIKRNKHDRLPHQADGRHLFHHWSKRKEKHALREEKNTGEEVEHILNTIEENPQEVPNQKELFLTLIEAQRELIERLWYENELREHKVRDALHHVQKKRPDLKSNVNRLLALHNKKARRELRDLRRFKEKVKQEKHLIGAIATKQKTQFEEYLEKKFLSHLKDFAHNVESNDNTKFKVYEAFKKDQPIETYNKIAINASRFIRKQELPTLQKTKEALAFLERAYEKGFFSKNFEELRRVLNEWLHEDHVKDAFNGLQAMLTEEAEMLERRDFPGFAHAFEKELQYLESQNLIPQDAVYENPKLKPIQSLFSNKTGNVLGRAAMIIILVGTMGLTSCTQSSTAPNPLKNIQQWTQKSGPVRDAAQNIGEKFGEKKAYVRQNSYLHQATDPNGERCFVNFYNRGSERDPKEIMFVFADAQGQHPKYIFINNNIDGMIDYVINCSKDYSLESPFTMKNVKDSKTIHFYEAMQNMFLKNANNLQGAREFIKVDGLVQNLDELEKLTKKKSQDINEIQENDLVIPIIINGTQYYGNYYQKRNYEYVTIYKDAKGKYIVQAFKNKNGATKIEVVVTYNSKGKKVATKLEDVTITPTVDNFNSAKGQLTEELSKSGLEGHKGERRKRRKNPKF